MSEPAAAAPSDRLVLYYRDPSGKPFYSAEPKKDEQGRDYRAVYDDSAPTQAATAPAATGKGKILYYRNPMGLPDTSPVPKKDSMNMDYIPVYEDEAAEAGSGAVRISLDKVQKLGVRTEMAGERVLTRRIRAV